MANPPAAVKLALESICLLLGESTTDWKQIRSIIMRENFIPTIVNFSAEEIRWVAPSGGNCSGGMRFSCLLVVSCLWLSVHRRSCQLISCTNTFPGHFYSN